MYDVIGLHNNDFVSVHNTPTFKTIVNEEKVNLVEQLQTTLSLEKMLEIFSMEVAKIVNFNSLSFLYEEEEVKVRGSTNAEFISEFPIKVENIEIGQIVYQSSTPISNIAKRQLGVIHSKVAYSLRNGVLYEKMQRLALKDSLTSLGNRRYFDETIVRMIQQAERSQMPFVLMLLDLDNFKQVNDKFGHQEGDKILQEFAQGLNDSVRGNDIIFRFGGDEFAILLDNCSGQTANIVASRVRHICSTHNNLARHGISASIGCAKWQNADSEKTLFSRADNALYNAKEAGKNCMKIA